MGWFSSGKCTSKARIDGKTVVITGCNTGIGKYTVLDLYARGARVVMACRDVQKAKEAVDWVTQQCAGRGGLGQLSVSHLDLSSLSSVKKCAEKLLDEESHIHILINNAGIMMCPRALTEDGYELQFATNHLGHFLFTLILLPKIINSAPAKIINVSSAAHNWSKSLCLDDINLEKSYDPQQSYFRSKLANILFSKELTKRLKGTGVNVYSVHPGAVDTDLLRHLDSFIWRIVKFFAAFFMKTPEQGAQTSVYCAIDEKTANETGLYYGDCQVTPPSALAQDDDLAKKLWDISLDMVKYTPQQRFGKSEI